VGSTVGVPATERTLLANINRDSISIFFNMAERHGLSGNPCIRGWELTVAVERVRSGPAGGFPALGSVPLEASP
jgi:hypothetical protein